MTKKRAILTTTATSLVVAPNLTYLGCNYSVLQEANVVALSMTALLILAVVGLGALAQFKPNKGIWALLIGVFVLSLSNIAYISGVALIIEGAGLAFNGYVLEPLITKEKIKELEANGQHVTYTKEIK